MEFSNKKKEFTMPSSQFKMAIAGIGVVLIIAGVALMLFFAYSAYQAFQNPQDVKAVAYVVNLLQINEPLLKGSMVMQTPQGPQPTDFQIEISPSFQAITFMVMGAIVFAIFMGIAQALVSGGSSIVKAAFYEGDRVYKS